ncbi:hypothetical protein [Bartonella schoenbuchensis]|uniref:hypothetical protein n=1 Tax=Bartonella schoenbuchensis TaxID=165694 RepID=UPI0031450C4D
MLCWVSVSGKDIEDEDRGSGGVCVGGAGRGCRGEEFNKMRRKVREQVSKHWWEKL